MGKRSPSAPDPYATAQAQSQANIEAARTQAQLNRGNTFSPFGTVTNRDLGEEWMQQRLAQDRAAVEAQGGQWNAENARRFFDAQNPNRNQWETRVTLSPEQQRIYDQGNQLDLQTGQLALDAIPRAQRILSSDVDTSGLPAWMRDDPDARDRATAGYMSRLEPQFARDREALEGRLLAQGFQPGTEAYRRAADELNRTITDARLQAVTAGLGESRAAAGFSNQQRGAQLAEMLQLRAQPINEMAALFGLGPGMQMPQAAQMQPVGVNAPDVASNIYQNYNARTQQQQATNANWFGLAGAGLGALGSYYGGLRRPGAPGPAGQGG
jgi:hypothetical protein